MYYSNADVVPERLEHPSVRKLCTLAYKLPHSELREEPIHKNTAGKAYLDIRYLKAIKCGGATLEFSLEYKSHLCDSIEAEI